MICIGIARKNIKHYVKCCDSPRDEQEPQSSGETRVFPISMPILYGPVDVPGMSSESSGKGFPQNVTFVQVRIITGTFHYEIINTGLLAQILYFH